MSGFDDSIRGDLDRWITTAPDGYSKTWLTCTACGDLFEPEDMEQIDEVREEGTCSWCWKAGERPEGWDGDDS